MPDVLNSTYTAHYSGSTSY